MTQFGVWTKLLIVALLGLATLMSVPNLLTPAQRAALPEFLPKKALSLGLDLQGGAHLALELDKVDLLNHTYTALEEDVRQAALDSGITYSGLAASKDGVVLTLLQPSQLELLRSKLAALEVTLTEGAAGQVTVVHTEAHMQALVARVVKQSLQVLRSRIDQFGVAEPLIQQEGTERIIVQLPGVKDISRAKAILGKTAQLSFHLVEDTGATGRLGVPLITLNEILDNSATVPVTMQKRPSLTGDAITQAGASFDQHGAPVVDIAFDSVGTQKFAKLSADNIGRRFAIVLDGVVYSSPVFREAILGGRAQISGNFTTESAQDLAAVLNAGALPAKVTIVEERTVGPSLGADSVRAGTLAMVGGLAAVLIFMTLFYGLFGVFANVALLFNLVILVAVMSAFGFTLTMPGMAGIVLTLGMAVDANVLIFERMREEVANGKKPLAAALAGFQGAFRTILDGHVTTLVAALVLFAFGTGPIKGFAVSLSIGLIASMFTSITLTRWLVLAWFYAKKPNRLPL